MRILPEAPPKHLEICSKEITFNNNKQYKGLKNKMSTLKGKVKWFNPAKGFGFIEREDKEKDAFVHISAVKEAGIQKLFENDKLEFELQDGPKGPSAVNLKKID